MTSQDDNMLTRAEHLAWCKERALEYLDKGDLPNTFASMCSDLKKHPETEKHAGIALGVGLMLTGGLGSEHEMRNFIEGFR